MIDREKIIKQVRRLAYKKLKDEFSGHDFGHVDRVRKLSLQIGRPLGANLFVLELAALLHDIDVKRGRVNHHLRGARVAGRILTKLGASEKIISQVQIAIRAHSYRGSQTNPATTLEAKIISDADKLDVMGAIGIARIFSFSGHFKRPIYDPKKKPDPAGYKQGVSRKHTAINAFYNKVLILDKVLYTTQAKKIAKERLNFNRGFISQFLAEWEGKK